MQYQTGLTFHSKFIFIITIKRHKLILLRLDLWPNINMPKYKHNLQVSVSNIRQVQINDRFFLTFSNRARVYHEVVMFTNSVSLTFMIYIQAPLDCMDSRQLEFYLCLPCT